MKLAVAAGLTVLALFSLAGSLGAAEPVRKIDKAPAVVDKAGNLRVPEGYHEKYQSLGTWAVAADKAAGSKQLHLVYASPGAVASFKKTGRFADGTVLVKEVYDAATAPMTTGTVSRAGALKGWFVMVKDGKGAHPGNPLWGDGWGWSWFDAGAPTKTTSTNYQTDCKGCHVPARNTDWIYTFGYPGLKR
jgi:hypothetical protein